MAASNGSGLASFRSPSQISEMTELGSGDFTTVLHVRQKPDGNEYVVKQIDLTKIKNEILKFHQEYMADKAIQAFRNEYEQLQRLSHPNINRLLSSFEEDGDGDHPEQQHGLQRFLFLVFDYCDGGSLKTAIQKAAQEKKPFSEWQIQLWARQLAAAVKCLHDNNLVHRNIKPSNVLLLSNSLTIRLGDFGLPTDVEGETLKSKFIPEMYLAPEFLKGTTYTRKCDMWSLGITLFHAANLELPFDSVAGILQKSPKAFKFTYSTELTNLLVKLLDKNKAKRPSIDRVNVDAFIWREMAPTTPEDLEKFERWKLTLIPAEFVKLEAAISEGSLTGVTEILSSPSLPFDGKIMLMERRNANNDDALDMAAYYGQVRIIDFLLSEMSANIESLGFQGETPLLRACSRSGNCPAIEFLLKKGANLKVENQDGANAIHLAAEFGDVDMVKFLLSSKPDWLEARSRKFGRTPFLHAICGQNVDVIEYLIDKGADVDAEETASQSQAIHVAATFASIDYLNYLIELRPQWLEARSRKGNMTPFLHAVAGNNVELVKFFISKGADLEAEDAATGGKAIHFAARFSDVNLVDCFLKLKPNLLSARTSKEGRTPFLEAALGGNLAVVEFLLKKGVSIDEEDNNGLKAIHLAACKGNIETVNYFLGLKPEWLEERSSKYLATPFLHAVIGNNVSVCRFLRDKGVDIEVEETKTRLRAIHLAARFAGVEMMQWLLAAKPEWLTLRTRIFGKTPLLCAMEGGKSENVKFFLDKGADLEEEDDDEGGKVIHWAAYRGSVAMVDYLLELKPEWLEVRSGRDGRTPFLYAASGGNFAVMEHLHRNKKADIVAEDTAAGSQAIHLACMAGNFKMVQYLLALKPDWLEAKARSYQATPFLYAVNCPDNLEIIKFLIDKGVDINRKDLKNGSMAIHWACQCADVKVVDYLLTLKPEWLELPNAKCKATPLIHAAIGGNLPVVQYLLAKGANIDAVDTVCGTAFHSAALFGHLPVVKFLLEKQPAFLELKNAAGQKPIDLAKKNEEKKVFAFLQTLLENKK